LKYLKYDELLSQCSSSALMDTLDSFNCRVQCMVASIRPLTPSMRAWGEAVTAYFEAVTEAPKSPFRLEMEVVDGLREGQVLVSQCNTQTLSAAWGGLLSTAASARGARGVVTDGAVRDYNEVISLNFPTFCRGLIPYDSLGRMDVIRENVRIECGGLGVEPGDLIFADVDGIVVVPERMADEVIHKALEKRAGERRVREVLRRGASVVDTFERYRIL
jgi:4-hydroxy-4-methyl-2-oxoglutarate aldolase